MISVKARPDRRADSSRGRAVWIDNIDLVTDWAPPKDAKRSARRKRAAGAGAGAADADGGGEAAAADEDEAGAPARARRRPRRSPPRTLRRPG